MTRIFVAFTVFKRFGVILGALKNIVAEINDLLGEFPQFRKVTPVSEELFLIVQNAVGLIGGLLAAIRLVLSFDSDEVDAIRIEAYSFSGEPVPDDLAFMRQVDSLLSEGN
jgi:hypothetical protein